MTIYVCVCLHTYTYIYSEGKLKCLPSLLNVPYNLWLLLLLISPEASLYFPVPYIFHELRFP